MADPRAVKRVREEDLVAWDTLPLSMSVVTYAPPRNLWANIKRLEISGCTFEEFLSTVSELGPRACCHTSGSKTLCGAMRFGGLLAVSSNV
eukprot:228213-Rhodomonas_salina.2